GIRIMGLGRRNVSGKLASIQGTFKSKKLGKFYAFLTGTENAVVIRWPDKSVAVSPADTEFFIYMVRSGAGLR
ncbi:MAG TPA: PH domain-containing protein, partial [Opitutaceae bacterium]